jgi:hypothetical protein
MLEDEGELEPLVALAGGEAGLTNIIANIMGGIVDNVGVEIQEGSGTVGPLRTATSSRPQTRGSVSGSLRSQSSVGTEQAREELAGIGGSVQDMVSGVITGVAGEFPSLPPSRPGTSGTGTVCVCVVAGVYPYVCTYMVGGLGSFEVRVWAENGAGGGCECGAEREEGV